MRADMLENRWTEQNPDNAAYPILSWDPQKLGMKAGNAGYWQNNTSAFLEDASYARLRNVTLGYNIPLKKGADITAMRLYFVGANLYTITKYSGWDVEVARETDSAGGRNVGGANNTFLTAPQEKSFMFGLDLTF